MNTVKEINRINERELELGLANKGSWHDAYKDSAYVFIGGLNYEMTEGDVITVFSQWGEIVDINMPRDQDTHKPKGFAFVMYEDQRSTVLAVDNMNGAQVLGRTVRVDHCKKYSQPGTRNAEGEYQEPEAPSYNAMRPILSDSEGDDGDDTASDAGSNVDDDDEADPMAKFLRAERKREKAEKRLLEGGDGDSGKKRKRDDADKAEKRKRKEERARIRAERDRKKREKERGRARGDREDSPDGQGRFKTEDRSRSRSRDRRRRQDLSTPPAPSRRDDPEHDAGKRDYRRSPSPVRGPNAGSGPSRLGRDTAPSDKDRRSRAYAERSRADKPPSPHERRGERSRDGRANRDDWREGRWELERDRHSDERDRRRRGPNDPSPNANRDHRDHAQRNGNDRYRDDRRNGLADDRYRDHDRPRNGDRRY